MGWFTRNKDMPKPEGNTEHQRDSRVEVVVHKNATKQVVEQAKAANDHLNNLLSKNGFTIKIYLAAGHTYPPVKTKKGRS